MKSSWKAVLDDIRTRGRAARHRRALAFRSADPWKGMTRRCRVGTPKPGPCPEGGASEDHGEEKPAAAEAASRESSPATADSPKATWKPPAGMPPAEQLLQLSGDDVEGFLDLSKESEHPLHRRLEVVSVLPNGIHLVKLKPREGESLDEARKKTLGRLRYEEGENAYLDPLPKADLFQIWDQLDAPEERTLDRGGEPARAKRFDAGHYLVNDGAATRLMSVERVRKGQGALRKWDERDRRDEERQAQISERERRADEKLRRQEAAREKAVQKDRAAVAALPPGRVEKVQAAVGEGGMADAKVMERLAASGIPEGPARKLLRLLNNAGYVSQHMSRGETSWEWKGEGDKGKQASAGGLTRKGETRRCMDGENAGKPGPCPGESGGSGVGESKPVEREPAAESPPKGSRARRQEAHAAEQKAWESRRDQREDSKEKVAALTDWPTGAVGRDRIEALKKMDPPSDAPRESREQRTAFRERAQQYAEGQLALLDDGVKHALDVMAAEGTPEKARGRVEKAAARARKGVAKAAAAYLEQVDGTHSLYSLLEMHMAEEPPQAPEVPQDAPDDDPRWRDAEAADEAYYEWDDKKTDLEQNISDAEILESELKDALDEAAEQADEAIGEALSDAADAHEAAMDKAQDADPEPEEPDWSHSEAEAEQARTDIVDGLDPLREMDLSEDEQAAYDGLIDVADRLGEDFDDDRELLRDYQAQARRAALLFGGNGNHEAALAIRKTQIAARRALRALGPEESGNGGQAAGGAGAGKQASTQAGGLTRKAESGITRRCNPGTPQAQPGPCPEGGKKTAKKPEKKTARKTETSHPGAAHGSKVKVRPTKRRAFSGRPVPVKHPLTKQETGRVGEAVSIAYLKMLGKKDARPMNSKKTNFPVDALEDHRPTEIKAGLVSNGSSAQQWRLTFSQESAKEKELYASMTPEERSAWNVEKQKRIRQRKQAVIKQLEKEFPGQKIKPRTLTVIVNPDTRTADVYEFDGFHDRIGWNSPEAKKAYRGSVRYG